MIIKHPAKSLMEKYFHWRTKKTFIEQEEHFFLKYHKIIAIPHCDYCNTYGDKTGDYILKTISKYQGRTSIMAMK